MELYVEDKILDPEVAVSFTISMSKNKDAGFFLIIVSKLLILTEAERDEKSQSHRHNRNVVKEQSLKQLPTAFFGAVASSFTQIQF